MTPSPLTLLPPELRERSRSGHDIVLEGEDALRAIDLLAAAGHRVEGWEGWVWLADGGRTRSLAHPGPFALPMDAARAAARAREGIEQARAAWARRPEYPGATLAFCLLVAPS